MLKVEPQSSFQAPNNNKVRRLLATSRLRVTFMSTAAEALFVFWLHSLTFKAELHFNMIVLFVLSGIRAENNEKVSKLN